MDAAVATSVAKVLQGERKTNNSVEFFRAAAYLHLAEQDKCSEYFWKPRNETVILRRKDFEMLVSMGKTVKLPAGCEAKRSMVEYLDDADNGWFNSVCYDLMNAYFRDLGCGDMCEAQIHTIFDDVYSCVVAIKNQRYTAEWGNRKEDGVYVLPDGTDFSKFTRAHYLPLYMPMLWWMMYFMSSPLTVAPANFEKIRLDLLERIREKFNSEDTEKPIFRRFDIAFEATAEQVEEAIRQIASTIESKAEWRGVTDELGLIVSYREKIDRENPHQGGLHKNKRLKYIAEDIERITGVDKLYQSVKKPASGTYPYVQSDFRKILASIEERNRQKDE